VENQCIYTPEAICKELTGVLHTFAAGFDADGFTITSLPALSGATPFQSSAGEAVMNTPNGVTNPAVGTDVIFVQVGNMFFSPPHITVQQGDTVAWDIIGGDHSVTSGKPGAPDGQFDSGVLGVGGQFLKTFDAAGVYNYYCSLHPGMLGSVTVLAPWEEHLNGPQVDATEAPSVFLQFFQTLNKNTAAVGHRAEVRLSNDGGLSWNVVYSHDPSGPTADGFVSLDVTGLAAGYDAVQVKWVYLGQADNEGAKWVIDDVVVGAGAPPETIDPLFDCNGACFLTPGEGTSNLWIVVDGSPAADSVFFSLKGAPGFVVATSEVPAPPVFSTNVVIPAGEVEPGSFDFYGVARDSQNLANVEHVFFNVIP
jgi:plastocyanin